MSALLRRANRPSLLRHPHSRLTPSRNMHVRSVSLLSGILRLGGRTASRGVVTLGVGAGAVTYAEYKVDGESVLPCEACKGRLLVGGRIVYLLDFPQSWGGAGIVATERYERGPQWRRRLRARKGIGLLDISGLKDEHLLTMQLYQASSRTPGTSSARSRTRSAPPTTPSPPPPPAATPRSRARRPKFGRTRRWESKAGSQPYGTRSAKPSRRAKGRRERWRAVDMEERVGRRAEGVGQPSKPRLQQLRRLRRRCR